MQAVANKPVAELVDYRTEPSKYRHWSLATDGEIATLTLNIDEDGGIRPGYKLKLNSYDLGVDIELHDALQRVRFEHPEVRTVVVTSGKPKIFCSGANIYMLGLSTHAWKVNFCKFTNETRNGIEDSSQYSGLKFLAACNGTTAGGGYELALACDEIVLVDDRNSSVSLPEVPLLGVLPGTGGLTRVTDKRRVRRDHADIFCTISEGVRGQRAKDWRLVDDVVKQQQFAEHIQARAKALAQTSDRPAGAKGVKLTTLERTVDEKGYHYEFVDATIDADGRTVTLTVRAPAAVTAKTAAEIEAQGIKWWPLQMARELDDAILNLRTNHLDVGLWQLRTEGDAQVVLDIDATIDANRDNWFVRETIGMLRRTLARIDVSSRSLYALIEPGSCFAGTLLEIALAADRSYMLDAAEAKNVVGLSAMNFGTFPMVNGLSRIDARFYQEEAPVAAVKAKQGSLLSPAEAMELGLVTAIPDDLDWAEEVRIAIEERAALSPDALTGLEANLRFGPVETMNTRIFGRLSAWQNWIFNRPNAVGENGALKLFGSGKKAQFDWNRV
ncbi:2,3-epoxybenzoyl-CoA dihydrolase [Aromatoleum evansii]|uniref:Benzoyl-CoA-dihydrodiol lyase n=2 Tax=Aromatoleum evansii TaxID=59406 RepID=BOXC_AROEV|nr:2,3-epoxybenzoyl-CoA dihydrolase [Aromatoleum evansii]Q84HH6.1 RecName: Full=Benzoyl-CoA-dihydrodiol lyase [Aromatoleum evansii]AAN39375.1 enoyl-CoA-hydratase/isomerase [Aromatoleum evansii]NMG27620.1 2,3-epoxybenzoyl-CoA dihydrolase [Aromatoleum evansii]WRL46320.1 2,3-epoxybenzoyl-CoA dihydrolase [Aromatoleum evansii]